MFLLLFREGHAFQSVAFQSVVAERVCTGCPECITDLNGIGMLTENLTYLLCSDFNAP